MSYGEKIISKKEDSSVLVHDGDYSHFLYLTMLPKNTYFNKFLYGEETPSFANFCQTAAFRFAITIPLMITFSNSVTIALTYLMGVFWLLGGHWKQRFSTVSSSIILLASLPLILWTAAGIFRYDDSLFCSFRYWLGHYPYLFIIIFSTLLARKKNQYIMLSSMNLSIMICCFWAIGFFLYYADLDIRQFAIKRSQSIYLYCNTICFGMALCLWGGLWVCFPYTSRHIGWVRKILPRFVLDGMRIASRSSLFDLFKAVFVSTELRRHPTAILLTLLRWGIVLSILVYLFTINPSRTAQLAVLFGYITLLLFWNFKKGFLIILCLLLPFIFVLGAFSNVFIRKANKTLFDIKGAISLIDEEMGINQISKKRLDRLSIWASLYQDMTEKPTFGYGMVEATEIVKGRSGYNDPHNEFIFQQIQHGAIGLACFSVFILSILIVPIFWNNPWKAFGVFLGTVVIINCFFNNAMSYHRETYLICISIALLAIQSGENKIKKMPARSIQAGIEVSR